MPRKRVSERTRCVDGEETTDGPSRSKNAKKSVAAISEETATRAKGMIRNTRARLSMNSKENLSNNIPDDNAYSLPGLSNPDTALSISNVTELRSRGTGSSLDRASGKSRSRRKNCAAKNDVTNKKSSTHCDVTKAQHDVIKSQNENSHTENNIGKVVSDVTRTCYKAVKPVAETSRNIVHYLTQCAAGYKCSVRLKQSIQAPVLDMVSDLQLYRTARPFDRRCTALEWHPTRHGVLAVASKGGDIILWNTKEMNHDKFIQGSGAGGSVQAIRFLPSDPECVVTSSIDGTVTVQDFDGLKKRVLLDTMNCIDNWYCSVDVNRDLNAIVAGDNTGKLTLMDESGKQRWTLKLHKNKITHTEFNPRQPWLLCTGSIDKTCKLWDVRMVKDKNSYLHVLHHDKPVNSAHFNPSDCTRLLTTDQGNEIRVYGGPAWNLNRTMTHPHRFFQHITPIKACWHPLVDVIAVGRYPDEKLTGIQNDRRGVDVLNADTGDLTCNLYDPIANGIVSLNQFSPQADFLASTMGVAVLIWSRKEYVAKEQELLMTKYTQNRDVTEKDTANERQDRALTKKKKTVDKSLKIQEKKAKEKLKLRKE